MGAFVVMNSNRTPPFCSRSDVPAHLSDEAVRLEHESADVPVNETIEDDENEIVAEDVSQSMQSRFCSCSDVPRPFTREPDEVVDARLDAPELDPETLPSDAAEASESGPQAIDAAMAQPDEWKGLRSASELLPGESMVYSAQTHGDKGSEAILTDRRVVLRGAPDAIVLFDSLRLKEIESVSISRARPNRRSLIWGLIGIAAAIGMWQALDGVGNMRVIIAGLVMLMSLVLLGDYALRPTDVVVSMRANSGAMMHILFSHSRSDVADKFAARVLAAVEGIAPSVRERGSD